MLTVEHIEYLLQDVLGTNIQLIKNITIGNGRLHIQFQDFEYTEPCFDFENPELTEQDFEMLDSIWNEIIKNKSNDIELKSLYTTIQPQNICFLKLAHYFANEHYLGKPVRLDNHNRITSNSVYRNIHKYLNFPMVDILSDIFNFNYLAINKQEGTVYFTSDFDYINLWSYLGFLKTCWRFLKHIIFLRRMLLIEEFWSYLLSKKHLSRNFMLTKSMFLFKDKVGKILNVKNIGFLLVEKTHRKYDFKNDYKQLSFKEYLNNIMGNVSFGIHPSYNTRYNPDSLKAQIETFEQTIFELPKYSRFHYLNCSFPDDLLPLEKHHIDQDFSFYFTDCLLFRGSISRPFKQWSYTKNRAINVEIVPLSIMDITLSRTLKLSFDEAQKTAQEKIRISLLLGRTCVLLWHNNELYEPLYKKNYSRRIMRSIKNYIEEIGSIL